MFRDNNNYKKEERFSPRECVGKNQDLNDRCRSLSAALITVLVEPDQNRASSCAKDNALVSEEAFALT